MAETEAVSGGFWQGLQESNTRRPWSFGFGRRGTLSCAILMHPCDSEASGFLNGMKLQRDTSDTC